jgi:hypothetical protein
MAKRGSKTMLAFGDLHIPQHNRRAVEWVNAFILGYLGRRSDTLYTIPIMDDRCILPDGTEVTA